MFWTKFRSLPIRSVAEKHQSLELWFPTQWDTDRIRTSQRADRRWERSLAPNWSLNSAQQVKCKCNVGGNAKNAVEWKWENSRVEHCLLCVARERCTTGSFVQALIPKTVERAAATFWFILELLYSLPSKIIPQYLKQFSWAYGQQKKVKTHESDEQSGSCISLTLWFWDLHFSATLMMRANF